MKKLLIGIIIIFVLVLSFRFVYALRNLSNPQLEGKSAPTPVITLKGNKMNYKYECFCWNENCSQKNHTPPSVNTNIVKSSDFIEIDWQNFKDKPNVVSLHNITTDEIKEYYLEDHHIKIDVSKQVTNPNEYEVIFQWYIGKSSELRGESYLTFNVKAD
jgi:uncharacterized protein YxeA